MVFAIFFCAFLQKTAYAITAQASISGVSNVALTTSSNLAMTATFIGTTEINYVVEDAKNYGLYFSSNSSDTTMSSTTTSDTITSISSMSSLNNFPANSWGYYLGTDNATEADIFSPILSELDALMIISKNLANTKDRFRASGSYKISFGIKIDRSIESATYTNTQIISLVAEDRPVILTDLTYMQEATAQICADTPTPSNDETTTVFTKQLIDRRDNKKYWTAKLADDNCWMTQNLAYNLSTSTTLTSTDSDVVTNWRPTANTTNNGRTGNTNTASIQSWNFGEYILNTPNSGATLCTNGVRLSSCSGASSMTNVASNYTDNYIATGMNTASLRSVDTSSRQFDAHYLVGNYYTWNAATAGSGTTLTNSNASSSVCPSAWRLGGSGAGSGAYANLFSTYGHNLTNSASMTTDQQNAIASAPLYFLRYGYVDPRSTSGLQFVGARAYLWGSWSSSSTDLAYGAMYFAPNWYPQMNTNRVNGMPIRCLVKS